MSLFFTKKKEEKLKDEISSLKHQVEDLKQIVKTQELIRLRSENERLLEKERLISHVHIKLKDVAYLDEENVILVKYDVSPVKVKIDDNNNPIKNETFYAINKLKLLSFDDMKKIQKVIDDLKIKQN